LPGADTTDLPFGCTLCGACHRTCPLSIEHPKLMLDLRGRVAAKRKNPLGAAHSLLARHPLAYRLAVGTARAVDPQLDLLPRLPGLPGLSEFVDSRHPPELKKSFTARRKAAKNKERA
jgi:L-lactate utilization protein LutB